MSNIVNNFTTGVITISEEYNISATSSAIDSTPYFNSVNEEYIISFVNLERVINFNAFTYETLGTLQTRYLETYYRISRNGTAWSEWLELNETIQNFPPVNPLNKLFIDIKFVRKGSKTDGSIRLVSFELIGELLKDETDGTALINSGSERIIKPPYVYKVFRIDDIEIFPAGLTDVEIFYRFSQNNSRSFTDWEPLTKENISTVRINPIRFFQIEYLVKNTGTSTVKIEDINLVGDFQNVTLDSQKTNLYGIRDCCQSNTTSSNGSNTSNSNSNLVDANGNVISNSTGVLDGQSCSSGNQFSPLTDEQKSQLYNPYQQTAAVNLLNKLSNDALEVFGWNVQYFVTDPDGKGIDYSLHEFGLFNIVCEAQLKVAVENNQFPDNQITMNQFDLNLFDSFEIHITKEAFKALFGVQRRPSKEDLVYFCDINRLFIVDHAQQFRNFNNYAIYYKVVLRKYNKALNVQAGNQTIKDRIDQLTNNSTIEQLMGIENKQDKQAVANKPQLEPLTRDPIRVSIKNVNTNSLIVKELIQNSTNIISKQHYDFSVAFSQGLTASVSPVIEYKNLSSIVRFSDNFSFFLWFRLDNYIEDENHNFFTNYDSVNNIGWKVNLINDTIILKLNSNEYTWSLNGSSGVVALNEEVWYCYLLNVDQRQRKLNQYIYKRNVDLEDDAKYLSSTVLKKVYSDERDMTPVEWELEKIPAQILVSDIKITNVRLFEDVIPEDQNNKILNQYVIADDAKYLVFADNANMILKLPNYNDRSQPWDKP